MAGTVILIVKVYDGTNKIDVSEELPSPAKGEDPGEPFIQVPFICKPPDHARLENFHVDAETKDPKMHDMADEHFHVRTPVKFPLLLREKCLATTSSGLLGMRRVTRHFGVDSSHDCLSEAD